MAVKPDIVNTALNANDTLVYVTAAVDNTTADP